MKKLLFFVCIVVKAAEINGSLTLARITAPSAPATSFSTLSVNVTTGTIGCINADSSNCFNVNLSGAAAPTLPATTTFYAIGASSGNSRELGIAYAGTVFHTGARYDGTPASPTAVQATEQVAGYNAFGYDGTTLGGPLASVRVFANQNFTASAHGSYMDFTTTPNGTTASAVVMRLENDAGVTVPNTVTGGDKGAGTINAGGLFVNGTAVSTTTGTVTSIATNNGITGGTITSTGTIGLASISANTLLGALTATTPTGLAVPSCSAAGNALNWTSGTGFGCGTGFLTGLVIGTTPISGSATNAILYSDGSVLQNATGVTRTGAGQFTHTIASIGTTPQDGLILTNPTAAAVGAQQESPAYNRCGFGWKTTTTAASQAVCVRDYLLPVQGAIAPTGQINWDFSINGGSYVTVFSLNSSGSLILADGSTTIRNSAPTSSNQVGIYAGGIIGLNRGGGNTSSFIAMADTVQGAVLQGGNSGGTQPLLAFASPTVGTLDTSYFRCSAGVSCFGKGNSTTANGLINLAGATFLDPTATTGATRVLVSLGAADSSSTVTLTNAGTTKSAGYQSSDGSAGATTTCTIAGLTSIVIKNGLVISCS